MMSGRDKQIKRITELENKLYSARSMLGIALEHLRFKSTPRTNAEVDMIEMLTAAINDVKPKPYSPDGYQVGGYEYQLCAVCDTSVYYEDIFETSKGFVCEDCS